MSDKYKDPYPRVIPNLEEWPISRLTKNRKQFQADVHELAVARILDLSKDDLQATVVKALYTELARLREEPWKADPVDEKPFWKKIRKTLLRKSLDKKGEELDVQTKKILDTILERYIEEITGSFQISTYKFARRFITMGMNRLLNAVSGRNMYRLIGSRYRLQQRLKIQGEIEKVRSLATKGTIILVPTHFSNLDSILLGWAIDSIGLPAFLYGAGLNLFSAKGLSYYMNRLGAYKVDRRKKNPIYLETLKIYARLAVEKGVHSLFFPGGTRSRSGMLENRLKLGLLGTVVEAQRNMYQQDKDNKIFIVPVILGYNFVLEAKSLIEDYLKRTGKENYIIEKDEFFELTKVTQFLWKFFGASGDILVSFGKPFDVMGNDIDMQGNSIDRQGHLINVKEYFLTNGVVTTDAQREQEYTQMLGDIIIDRFHRENIVMSSHLVSYVAFNMLAKNLKIDLYALLRLDHEDFYIPVETFGKAVAALKEVLLKLEEENRLKLAEPIHWDVDKLIRFGIKNLGVYHVEKPLRIEEHEGEEHIVCDNFNLLFYYHNRLEGFDLANRIDWSNFQWEEY